jgi:hypothetical protein
MDRDLARVDARLDRFERELERRFDKVDARLTRLEEQRFDSMQRLLLAAYVTVVVGLVATQL